MHVMYFVVSMFQELTFDQVVESLGQSAEGALADLLVTQALNAMGVTPYLKEVPCSLSDTLYTGHQNGWTKGIQTTLDISKSKFFPNH